MSTRSGTTSGAAESMDGESFGKDVTEALAAMETEMATQDDPPELSELPAPELPAPLPGQNTTATPPAGGTTPMVTGSMAAGLDDGLLPGGPL